MPLIKYILIILIVLFSGCSKKAESQLQDKSNWPFKIQVSYCYIGPLEKSENDLFIQYSKNSKNKYIVDRLNLVTTANDFFDWYSAINKEKINIKLPVSDSEMKFRLRLICENRVVEDLYIYDDGLIINYNYYGLPKIFKEDSNAIFLLFFLNL